MSRPRPKVPLVKSSWKESALSIIVASTILGLIGYYYFVDDDSEDYSEPESPLIEDVR